MGRRLLAPIKDLARLFDCKVGFSWDIQTLLTLRSAEADESRHFCKGDVNLYPSRVDKDPTLSEIVPARMLLPLPVVR